MARGLWCFSYSYSYSAQDNVIKYVNNQKEQHRKKTFKEEYLDFLDKFNIEYRNEYLFKWFE